MMLTQQSIHVLRRFKTGFFFLPASVCFDAPAGFSIAVTDELRPFRHTWYCLKVQALLTSVSDYNRHAWKCGAT